MSHLPYLTSPFSNSVRRIIFSIVPHFCPVDFDVQRLCTTVYVVLAAPQCTCVRPPGRSLSVSFWHKHVFENRGEAGRRLDTRDGSLQALASSAIPGTIAACIIVPHMAFIRQRRGNFLQGLSAPIGIAIGLWVVLRTVWAILLKEPLRWNGDGYTYQAGETG